MKILITNYSLEYQAGSETWTMTMFNELSKKHEVNVYVSRAGKNCLIDAGSDYRRHYDLAIINHNSCLKEIMAWNIDKRIFTSHGIIPALEQPTSGADAYVSVSEEVQSNLRNKGFESVIIRNPIDTDYFNGAPGNEKLKNILFLNNHAKHIDCARMVRAACSGYEFRVLSGWKTDVKENILWADLVISSGRGCYESLSCGKNVMVVNQFGCDGMVTEESIFELRKNNCSGRRFDYDWTTKDIVKEFGKYDPERNMRDYILANNNVRTIAGEYLDL